MTNCNICQVCFQTKESTKDEIFVNCANCSLGFHRKCYGCKPTSDTKMCRYCHALQANKVSGYEDAVNNAIKCLICNQSEFGALKSAGKDEQGNQRFVHLVCAQLTAWTYLENPKNMSPIKGIERCLKYKVVTQRFICSICNSPNASIKCREHSCQTFYHPLCLNQFDEDI